MKAAVNVYLDTASLRLDFDGEAEAIAAARACMAAHNLWHVVVTSTEGLVMVDCPGPAKLAHEQSEREGA